MDEARHTGVIAVLCLLTGLAAVHAIKVVIEPLPKGKLRLWYFKRNKLYQNSNSYELW